MFFKDLNFKAFMRWSFIATATLLVACAGEEAPYFESSNVQLKGAGCLAETFGRFDEFLEGKLNQGEVAAFWDCADTALLAVERRVVGSAEGGNLKSTDIRWFVGRYFLKSGRPDGIVISDALLDELMEIKRLFLGGSRGVLTRLEIEQTKSVIQEFKIMSLAINPYIRDLFYADAKTFADRTHLGKGIQAFSFLVERFGQLLDRQKVAYSFQRLHRLLDEIDLIFSDKGKNLPEWTKYLENFQRIKSIFLNSSMDEVESWEWPTLSSVAGHALGLYFRGKHFFNSASLHSLDKVVEFEEMFKGLRSILDEALDRRNGQAFKHQDFSGIISELAAADKLPIELSVDEIQTLWVVLTDQVLSTHKGEGGRDDEDDKGLHQGLSRSELGELGRLFDNWYLTQLWLLGEKVPEDVTQKMRQVLDTPWPYRTDGLGRLIFDDNKSVLPNIESTTQLNWQRAAFELVIRGYAKDPQRRDQNIGLTREELDVAFHDIRPIFVQMGLVESGDEGFQNRTFLQSSLFVPRSNGDDIFDYVEMIEYTQFVFAGIEMGRHFVSLLDSSCWVEEDVLKYNCWREGIWQGYKEAYANMPYMVEFLSRLRPDQFSKVFDRLETATRNEDDPVDRINRSDVYEVGIFMQYIETLMFRFDEDRSGMMEIDEGLKAVPIFTPRLKELADIDSDKEIRYIITFMMRYGHPPDTGNLLSLWRYVRWRMSEKNWEIRTDRDKVIQILSSLSSFL